jgi:hypothetical protein
MQALCKPTASASGTAVRQAASFDTLRTIGCGGKQADTVGRPESRSCLLAIASLPVDSIDSPAAGLLADTVGSLLTVSLGALLRLCESYLDLQPRASLAKRLAIQALCASNQPPDAKHPPDAWMGTAIHICPAWR